MEIAGESISSRACIPRRLSRYTGDSDLEDTEVLHPDKYIKPVIYANVKVRLRMQTEPQTCLR